MADAQTLESPLEPIRTIVVKPHDPNGDETQLELKLDDIVYVLEQDETGWWGGHKEKEDFTGWFPGTCVRPFPLAAVGSSQQPHAPGIDASMDGATVGAAVGTSELGPRGGSSMKLDDAGPSRCGGPLETSTESPVRQKRLVASPQMRDPNRGANKANATAPADVAAPKVEALATENVRLQQQLQELAEALKSYQRQSDLERHNISKVEAILEEEKRQRAQLERELEAERASKDNASSQAAHLKDELERERRCSQSTMEDNEKLKNTYESQLRDKTEEIKFTQEKSRQSIESERQRAKMLEEQIRSCQDELTSLRRDSKQQLDLSVTSSKAEEFYGRVPRGPVPPSCPPPQVPSARCDQVAMAPAATQPLRLPLAIGTSPAGLGKAYSMGDLTPGYQAATRAAVPRSSSRTSRPEDGVAYIPKGETSWQEERPPRGCVAEKVTALEQRCRSQTPRRDFFEVPRRAPSASSASFPTGGHLRSTESRHASRQRPLLEERPAGSVRTLPTTTLPTTQSLKELARGASFFRGLELRGDEDEEAGTDQLFLGMSPIR